MEEGTWFTGGAENQGYVQAGTSLVNGAGFQDIYFHSQFTSSDVAVISQVQTYSGPYPVSFMHTAVGTPHGSVRAESVSRICSPPHAQTWFL